MTKAHLTTTALIVWLLGAAGAFLRLYNIPGTLQFLGDQGRDALIVANIFKNADLVFIGPVTSVGNMYLGPLYYYFMVPFLWLSYPSPLGPAYAVAVLGILTVFLMYYLGKELIGEQAAVIATSFYAFSAVVIEYTRFSWNPNPAPLVSLVMIWSTYRAVTKSPWYWLGTAAAFSILVQLHYITLLALGGAGLIWLAYLISYGKPAWFGLFKPKAATLKLFLLSTCLSIGLFVASLTPLVLFDLKHDGLNSKAFQSLFTEEKSFKVSTPQPFTEKIADTLEETHGRTLHILFEFSLGKHRNLNTVLAVITLTGLIWVLTQRQRPTHLGEVMIATFLGTAILGLSFYEHSIFDHYIAYLFPVTFWVYGIVLSLAWKNPAGKSLVVLAWLAFISLNAARWPLKTVGWTLSDIQRTSSQVYEHLKPGEKYNLVLLSETKDLYGQNYRYFLSTQPNPPLPPERSSEADALVIINEQHLAQPINTEIYEINIFPTKIPDEVYTIDRGPEILILRNNQN